MRACWLLVLVAIPACEGLIGADFDRAHPAPGSGGTAGSDAASEASFDADATDGDTTDADASTCTEGVYCYDGPPGTETKGFCHAGIRFCTDAGPICNGQSLPTFEDPKTPADESCDGFLGSYEAGIAFGGTGDQVAEDVAIGLDGYLMVTASFQNSFTFGTKLLANKGGYDFLVARIDPTTLETDWVKSFGSNGNDHARAIATDGGNAYVTGTLEGPIDFGDGNLLDPGPSGLGVFVAKFTALGTLVWSRVFGSPTGTERPYGLATDQNGDVAIVGVMDSSVQFGTTPTITSADENDAFLVKLDGRDGEPLWAHGFVGGSYQVNMGVTTDSSGRVIVTGTTAGPLNVAGLPIEGAGARSYVAVFSSTGTPDFSRALGPCTSYYEIAEPSVHASNAIFVATTYTGIAVLGNETHSSVKDKDGNPTEDILVAKLDAGGTPVWSKSFGGAANEDNPKQVVVDSVGNVIITGDVEAGFDCGGGSLAQNALDDAFIMKLDGTTGNALWCWLLGGALSDHINGAAIDATDAIWVAGEFNGTWDFGAQSISSPGSSLDGFLLKFTP